MSNIPTPPKSTPNPPPGAAPSVTPATPPSSDRIDTAALVKAVAKSSVGTTGTAANTVAHVDSIPANWIVVATEDPDVIDCTNNVSGSTFVGTHKNFGLFMRGKLNAAE